MITSEKIKNLRLKTGAGMMDCKKALEEVNGDIDSAVDWLRKRGISKAQKKSTRDASEGLITIAIKDQSASIVEINCETDFVARNQDFQLFCEKLSYIVVEKKILNIDDLLNERLDSNLVKDELTSMIAKVGENLVVKRINFFKGENVFFQKYIHNAVNDKSGKIGVLLEYSAKPNFKDEENITKNLCMHIAATDPKSIFPEDLSSDLIDREKSIFVEQLSSSGKPKDIIEKIVEGKINKFYEEVCLFEQYFVMDNKIKIRQYLNNYNMKYNCDLLIKNFIIFKVGEISA
mgnify:CR=1 FL=1